MLEKASFGIINGKMVTAYTLVNKNGVKLTCLDYGATLYRLTVPVAGQDQNLVVTLAGPTGYANPGNYYGKCLGRVAGRIGRGQYCLNGKTIALSENEGTTTLHGGPGGFGDLFWETQIDTHQLIFTHHVASFEDGFPNELEAKITYTLGDDDTVTITYTGTATKGETLFNPTNHVYWNLNRDDQTIENHMLQIDSTQHFELQADKVPTGRLLANSKSPFDFSQSQNLGTVIEALQTTTEKGLDDIFLISEHAASQPMVRLSQGNIGVDIYSKRNALVVYTTNQVGTDQSIEGRQQRRYTGLALETQTAPSALVDSKFGSIRLADGDSRTEKTLYVLHY